MSIVIATFEEYKAAKQEIQSLKDASTGTPDHARLIELVEAIDAWEARSLRAPLAI